MTETTVESPVEVPKKGKGKALKKTAKTTGKPKVPSHPPTAQMVDSAIKSLNDKGGSSLQAIKKYIAAQYKLDTSKASSYIKKYLKTSVASGKLVQTKGSGASGSFKFPSKDKPAKAAKPKKVVKRTVGKIASKAKPVAKKTKTATKSPAKPKPKKLKVTSAKPKKAVKKVSPKKKTSPKKK